MNENDLIELFRASAQAHSGVNWFRHGSVPFAFSAMNGAQYPFFYLQSIGQSSDGTRLSRNFTAYCLVTPLPEENLTDQFVYDDTIVQSRDTALQILQEVIGRVRLTNLSRFTLEHTAWVDDANRLLSDTDSGAVGWRTDFTITSDFLYNNSDFPTI